MNPTQDLLAALRGHDAAAAFAAQALGARDAGDFATAASALQGCLHAMLSPFDGGDPRAHPLDRVATLVARGVLKPQAYAATQRFFASLEATPSPTLRALDEAAAGLRELAVTLSRRVSDDEALQWPGYLALFVLIASLATAGWMVLPAEAPTDATVAEQPAIAAEAKPEHAQPAVLPTHGKVKGTNVILRAGPSTRERAVTVLRAGEALEILDERQTEGDGREAKLKVPTRFFAAGTTEAAFTLQAGKAVEIVSPANADPVTIAFVSDGVRGTARLAAADLDALTGKPWFNVRTTSGKSGWVFGEFVATSP